MFELFATPVGTLEDSANGGWVESTKTLTPATSPNWIVNALVGCLTVRQHVGWHGGEQHGDGTGDVDQWQRQQRHAYGWSITSPNLVLVAHYAYAGDFYNYISSIDAAPFAGSVTKIRFYNNSTQSQTM